MCVYSNIGDHYRDRDHWPWRPEPYPFIPHPPTTPPDFDKIWKEWEQKQAKAGEIDDLKKRIEALEELIRRGKEYDEAHGHPACELDEKKELLRKLAKELGVEINL